MPLQDTHALVFKEAVPCKSVLVTTFQCMSQADDAERST